MKPSFNTKILNNQRGQVAVEYILITVVLVGIFLAVRNTFISDNVLGNFVQKPWALVAGMVETGVWGDPKKVRADHPGKIRRHSTHLGVKE